MYDWWNDFARFILKKKDKDMTSETILVGGMPVARLKEALKAADDEHLATFLRGYALGFAADQFIAAMTKENERVGFIIAVAGMYPDDWIKALDILEKMKAAGK